jgi:hypothetical protein
MTAQSCPRCGAPAAAAARFCRTCGAPLAAGTDPEPTPVPAPKPSLVLAPEQVRSDTLAPARAWWNRRPRGRTPWLAGLGVALIVVLALVGYLAAVAISNAKYPPDQPVRALFAALAAHDTATAAELATCTSPACTGTTLATGYEAPTDLQVGKISYGDPADDTRRPDKSIAYVPVTYRLGGAPQAVIMRVQRAGTGLARPFRIVRGATGRLTITAAHVEQVQLGGELVPVDKLGTGVAALPGRYTVQVPNTDPLFAPTSAAPARIDVTAAADERATPAQLSLSVQIRPDVVAQVDEQVRAFLAACAKQDTLTPTGCPFRVPGIVIGEADVHWSVEQLPTIEIIPTDQPGPTDPPASVRTVTPGQATVTYNAFTSAGGARSTITQQLPIEITGTVDVDPAQPGRVLWSG